MQACKSISFDKCNWMDVRLQRHV